MFDKSIANKPVASQLQIESLEERSLMSAAFPTNYEQYMVELINKARATPESYAASLGIALNEGLAAGTITTTAKQPLAINPYLTDSAAKHSQWMVDTDTFSHTGSSSTSPTQRMQSAGYVLQSPWSTGENIGYRGTTGTPDVSAFTKALEESLFVDASISGRGHRRNILSETFSEVGVGIRTGPYGTYNAVMATQDFAKTGTAMYLTGVAFADTVTADSFYTPGEGLVNISIVAIRDGNGARYTTSTWASGGYRLELPKGRYSIWATGPALTSAQFIPSMNIGTKNMKRDFMRGVVRVAPEVAAQGNGVYIPNKDITPRAVDGTDYGGVDVSSGSLTKSYSILNVGNGSLNLTGSPRIIIGGANAADFVVTAQPGSSIAGDSSTTFSVKFDPTGSGLRTAVISIASNDGNEIPFTFTIVGTGTAPAMMAQSLSSSGASTTLSVSNLRSQVEGALAGSFGEPARSVSSGAASTRCLIESIDLSHYVQALNLESIQAIGAAITHTLRAEALFSI